MLHSWPALEQRFARALARLEGANPARITDLRASSLFFFLHYLVEQEQNPGDSAAPLLVITETTAQASRMQQFLTDVTRLAADREPLGTDYLVFPDFEPQNLFEYSEQPVDIIDARNGVLDGLRRGTVRAVFTSYKACWRKLQSPDDYFSRSLVVTRKGGEAQAEAGALSVIQRDELGRSLDSLGYRIVTTVTQPGEYAMRGGLVDVFPLGLELPVRIDLFGDEIEEIHSFAPDSQRTTEHVAQVRILPASTAGALLGREETIDWLQARWEQYYSDFRDVLSRSTLERLEDVVHSDLDVLARRGTTPRAGWYEEAATSSYGIDQAYTLWNYLPPGARVVFHEANFVESETMSYFRFWENRFSDWIRNGLGYLGFDSLYLKPASGIVATAVGLADGELQIEHLETHALEVPELRPLLTSSFGSTDDSALEGVSMGLDSVPAGAWGTARIVKTIAEYPKLATPGAVPLPRMARIDRPVTVLTQFSARLREIVNEAELYPEIASAILPGGFVIPAEGAEAGEWTLITDMEVFGEIAEVGAAPVKRYRKEGVRRPDDLAPGDYVVHIDYGIGRFAQLTDRQQSGVTKSYVEIEYAGRDRLFVPVEQLDRLRRYSYDGTEPTLNNLGKDSWKKTKDKVRHDTLELARKLLSLYKTRQIRPGYAYSQTTIWEEEFADGFPYTLTEDQLNAWRAVEDDMESEKPMDRLLCGDVGFGKTEIAMRAAFKACVDERQVLVLCPTTVLADQHYTTFSRRFRPFPFTIAALSRFQSKAEQKAIVERVKEGKVDVLVATHRALSKDVDFTRLGLLVVDEEQRFGVKQKEAMKMRWSMVDVLSMSATPIPRTLHMSLIGVRDISLIETAPAARKSVKTYVGEYDEIMVREALMRELGRGGQVYFLHNKIQDIESIKADIERLVPEEKILIAHGQMREDRLEEVMHAFSLGAYKIMLSTTIIENGLDIPSVNTIILDGAENLGLAQMHQLRGRVGRSAVQAYAYFFHTPNRMLTEDAQNRLHAIYNYAYLGAGYEIAMSDLRIRGAGNLLGEAQSGLARQVGFEYYCELLASSISDVKALDLADIDDWEEVPLATERPGTQLDLPLPSFIPHEYIEDPVLRLEMLRHMAAIDSPQGLTDLEAELTDRFGDLPQEVLNLINVIAIKNAASQLGLERLGYNRVKQRFLFSFFDDEPAWFKRAALQDGRFTPSGAHALELDMAFEGESTAQELQAILDGLSGIRERANA